MKRTNIALLLLILIVSAGSFRCTDDVPSPGTAVLVTEESIKEIPGYGWFGITKNNYNPDKNTIKEIAQLYDSSKHHFIIFSKPACSCDEKQQLFPYLMKVLDTAGVQNYNYTIYSVKSVKTTHPYDSLLTLRFIPALYLVVDGKPVYSIIDSMLNSSTNNYKIEIEILKALQKYK